MKCMQENQETGHQKVLFHIKWDMKFQHYYLNAGAYNHEEEVLLMDGVILYVDSVSEETNDDGKKSYTLITLIS